MSARLLFVDDEIELMLALVAAARARGYVASGTIDARDVLPRVESTCPDLVVLDLRMPPHDGRDLLAKLRALPMAPQVLVLTGMLDEHTEHLCRAYGATDVVRKPFELADLFRRIERATSVVTSARR